MKILEYLSYYKVLHPRCRDSHAYVHCNASLWVIQYTSVKVKTVKTVFTLTEEGFYAETFQ